MALNQSPVFSTSDSVVSICCLLISASASARILLRVFETPARWRRSLFQKWSDRPASSVPIFQLGIQMYFPYAFSPMMTWYQFPSASISYSCWLPLWTGVIIPMHGFCDLLKINGYAILLPSQHFVLYDKTYHPVIDQAPALLKCIHQAFLTVPVDPARDPGRFFIDFFQCLIRKDLFLPAGIRQMGQDVPVAFGTVQMRKDAVDINALADRGIALQLQLFPQFCLSDEYKGHRAGGVILIVKKLYVI